MTLIGCFVITILASLAGILALIGNNIFVGVIMLIVGLIFGVGLIHSLVHAPKE